MKKIWLLVIGILLIFSSLALGQDVTLTLDWTYENTTLTNVINGAYNYATDKFYACIYEDAAKPVHILDGSNGTDTGGGLIITGLTFGSLNVIGICVTTDGVIYGGTNTDPDSLIRWANEAATPTEQIGVTDLQLCRCMDVLGTGTDTKIFVTGETDNSDVDILTTIDGVSFSVTDTTIDGLGKHGLAVAKTGDTVFVSLGYLGNVPTRCDKIVGTWTLSTTFTPVGTATPPDLPDVNTPCPMGYWDEQDVLFVIDTLAAGGNDNIRALNGSTGALLTNIATGRDVGAYGYGTIDTSPATDNWSGTGAFIVRAPNLPTGYMCGKFSFSVPGAPTPEPGAGVDLINWGLYE